MSALVQLQNPAHYNLQKNSVWIFADGADIWITRGESGLSITVWQRDASADPLEAIHIPWSNIKGDRNEH